MRTQLPLLRLAALALLVTLALLPNLALAAPQFDVCRRLWGTEEWTRRCAPDRPAIDPAAHCRRVWGTEEWTRRCAQLIDDDDLAAYCRRVWGTEDWTRRCAAQQPDPPRPEPNPVAGPAARGPH